jgi:NAD(P)-dependent dehydrogenase (short-subunit alcohol dehydrogenase family)
MAATGLAGELDFGGRRVLLTGAAGGLGRAMAALFAAHGAQLLLADREAGALQALARELGIVAECHGYDQGDAASVKALARAAGAVDVLVNNAGIMLLKPLLEADADDFRRVFEVDAIGPMLLATAVARTMVARGSGVIVNVGSQLVGCGAAHRGVYAAAKAALQQFTRTAAAEWGRAGVRVVCAAPGRTVTPMNEAVLRAEGEAGLARIALGRYGTAAEAARLVLFLASPAAAYITGSTVVADGGFVIG